MSGEVSSLLDWQGLLPWKEYRYASPLHVLYVWCMS